VDRTLVIVKPDGVERSLIGEIIRRLEQKGLALVAGEFRTLDRATATRHYVEHEGQPYYDGLLSFITRGPVFVMVVEGPDATWKVVRSLIGATNAADAIRGDLASDTRENLVHGSDSLESAIREIGIFFPQLV
jgi:nucleoside-diphosphate kinase